MTTSSPEAISMARQNRMKAEADLEKLYELNAPLVEGEDNHNYLALRGADVDDMEFVEEFGVPKEYAYTKKLNDWMLDHQQTKNEQFFTSEGL